MKKILKVRWITTLLLVVGAVVFFSFKSGDSRTFQIAKNLDIFNSIVKELDMFYVDTLDPNKTIREGIDAMLYSLDPYTEFYPEEDRSELEQMLKASYGGIGSIIRYEPKLKRTVIVEPYENMPAAEVGMNRSAFCSYFKRCKGMTFSQFVTQYRLNTACELLKHSQKGVSEICYLVGFNDLPHFIRIFTKSIGTSPSKYRKQYLYENT